MRADDGTRTRDPHLGKVMRYQLRYIRICTILMRVLSVHGSRGPLETHPYGWEIDYPAFIGGDGCPCTTYGGNARTSWALSARIGASRRCLPA